MRFRPTCWSRGHGTREWYCSADCWRKNASALRVGAASLAASVSFFVISNFAVWAVWNMYPKTASGLAMCYVAGLPFFRNAVVSDLFFAGAFFGIGYLVSHRQEEAVTVAR